MSAPTFSGMTAMSVMEEITLMCGPAQKKNIEININVYVDECGQIKIPNSVKFNCKLCLLQVIFFRSCRLCDTIES